MDGINSAYKRSRISGIRERVSFFHHKMLPTTSTRPRHWTPSERDRGGREEGEELRGRGVQKGVRFGVPELHQDNQLGGGRGY